MRSTKKKEKTTKKSLQARINRLKRLNTQLNAKFRKTNKFKIELKHRGEVKVLEGKLSKMEEELRKKIEKNLEITSAINDLRKK